MKKTIFFICVLSSFLMLFSGCVVTDTAQQQLSPEEQAKVDAINSKLPFGVSIDGNAAKTNSAVAAVIEEPVTATSELVCDTENKDIINITFMPSNKDGIVVPGKTPELIILRDGNKTTLDQTTDKKKLQPGYYIMDVTSGDKTARIVIEIK